MSESFGGALLVQVALLVIYYGFHIDLPWWVLWFPSLIIIGILAIVAILFVMYLIGEWVFNRW